MWKRAYTAENPTRLAGPLTEERMANEFAENRQLGHCSKVLASCTVDKTHIVPEAS